MGWFRKKPRRVRDMLFEPPQPTRSMLRAIAEFRNSKKPTHTGAIYHGGCIGCVYLKDNDTRAGIEWCLGCHYSNNNLSLPDRSARLPSL